MPVTGKLSRRFYEKLGDDVANELVDWLNAVDTTYRSDLRELNELNFARFDAKLEQRFAQQDAKWEARFAKLEGLEARLEAKFDAKLVTGLAGLRTDLVRWMFAFWTGTMIALAGFLLVVLRSRGA